MTKNKKLENNINNPSHYQILENIEAIDIIEAVLSKEAFYGFCYGNVIKYMLRADKKNGLEDFKKAQHYLEKSIKVKEEMKLKEM